MRNYLLVVLLSLILFPFLLCAQPPVQSSERQRIDAKRIDADPFGKDALMRSREFLRIDDSYYVGWMYEGLYKERHAADFLGYKNAVVPLEKALGLLEKDYARQLRTRSSDLMSYYPAFRFHLDYSIIANALAECYGNIHQPENAFKVARRAIGWNFQREFYFNSYIQMSWLTHRNRFYKTDDYFFLKRSIPENEALANAYLDSALVKIRKDSRLNEGLFQPGYEKMDEYSVYHYKAILYSYDLNIDSADKYYNLLKETPMLSFNNYGTYLAITGRFREAEKMYEMAAGTDMGDKRLQEWAYYTSILHINKGQPVSAAENMADMIKAAGSTPGFGWYNIALARAENYKGDIENSGRHLHKAEAFKEVHIGTTLGQSHYEFSINLVKLMNQVRRIEQIKFEHRGWWYQPKKLFQVFRLTIQKYLLEYLIVNQLAANPERDKVVYPLFSTESTVGWDEIWFLIRDFSTSFFYKKFQKEIEANKRPLINKYYELYLARLQMERGDYKEAAQALTAILENHSIDPDYEKLFLARCFESLSICYSKLKNEYLETEYASRLYETYPQLIPFSGIKLNMRMNIAGSADRQVLNRLKKVNINWAAGESLSPLELVLDFHDNSGKKSMTYRVLGTGGEELVAKQELHYQDPQKAAVDLGYRLFNIDVPD